MYVPSPTKGQERSVCGDIEDFLKYEHHPMITGTVSYAMRSMRGDLFPVVEGPCKKYALAGPGTYVRLQLPPGA
jgi:hypothetical protein